MNRVLLLEDDFSLAREIAQFFTNKHMTCDVVYDGSLLLKQFQVHPYHIVILDINVPGMNGLEVCRQLRETDARIPIIMLTAFGEIDDKIKAFQHGADDYLVKPFHFDELFVRVNALLRRGQSPQTKNDLLEIGDLSINLGDSMLYRNGQAIALTPKEFKLMVILAKARGRVVSKQHIAEQLWDDHIETNPSTIEVYINFLRNKVDRNFTEKYIHTKVGFGYYLKKLDDAEV